MVKCPGCTAENDAGARFCFSCGTPMTARTSEASAAPPPPPPPPRTVRPGARLDVVGLFGLAVVLIVVGTVFAANPALVDDLRAWVDRLAQQGIFVRPPEGI